MKIAILGGHLSPALAVIDRIPKNWDPIFIGRKFVFEGEKTLSFEYLTINKIGVKFENLTTGRLQRRFTSKTIPSLLKLPIGLAGAFRILRRNRPDIIVGFGGYIQLPVVLAAYALKIPVVIHEQTLEAGASNKFCAKFASKVLISWESSDKFFPKNKTVVTGMPLRNYTVKAGNEKTSSSNKIPQLFIIGGSSGSHFINTLIEEILDRLLSDYKVIHQTGDSKKFEDFKRLEDFRRTLSKEKKERYDVRKFVDTEEFSLILKDSDVVISRSGINTASELLYFGKPNILIPIPFSQRNEQYKNALLLKDYGITEILEQGEVNSEILLQEINKIIDNLGNYKLRKKVDLPFEKAADTIIKEIAGCVREN